MKQYTPIPLTSRALRMLKGVGEKKEKLLNKVGIASIADLVFDFPTRYIDRRFLTVPSLATYSSPITVQGTVTEIKRIYKGYHVTVNLGSSMMTVKYIHYPYAPPVKEGEEYYFYGEYKEKTMVFPSVSHEHSFLGIIPVYRLTEGLKQKEMRRWHRQALDIAKIYWQKEMPDFVWSDEDLLWDALETLHQPKSLEKIEKAKQRVVLQQLFDLRVKLLRLKHSWAEAAPVLEIPFSDVEHLPFKLTESQEEALRQIDRDLQKGQKMNRLLQGDVGSGKSVVAYLTARSVLSAKGQAVFYAPTTILATQLYQNYIDIFGEDRVALLTSQCGTQEKKKILSKVAEGEVYLLFGTHAVMEESVIFANLQMIIGDEQQRFGVRQKQLVQEKSVHAHSLFLSATPIPRTLALSIYADMDITRVRGIPKGRQPIHTSLVSKASTQDMLDKIADELTKGRQVFFITPSIVSGFANLEAVYQRLKQLFPTYTIAMAHGQMKRMALAETMNQFAERKIDILVATTVIEVGIDVPNATVMVIMEADRFGLAQLHQIRGRVGRGSYASYCFLMTRQHDVQRLERLIDAKDGFEIAEADLAMRGPGAFFGTAQSGEMMLFFPYTTDILKKAVIQTDIIFEAASAPTHPHHQDAVEFLKTIDIKHHVY